MGKSQRTWGGKLGSTLVRMGFAREEDILRALSSQLLLPAVDFNKVKVSNRAILSVPLRVAEKYHVIPIAIRDDQGKKEIVLVMSDPTNIDSITEIEFQTGCRVRPAVATDSSISRAIDFYYRSSGAGPLADVQTPKVGVSADAPEPGKMEIVEEVRLSGTIGEGSAMALESLSAGALLKVLVRVLIRKGVISKADLTQELHRRKT